LEEWIPRDAADEVTGGLPWSRFCLRGQPRLRIAPKPVFVRLLFSTPHPINPAELRARMREFFARAVREWIEAYEQHGDAIRIAP